MKKVVFWISLLLVCLVTSSCSEDIDDTVTDSVYLYTTSINAPAAEDTQSVTVSATMDWTAAPQADWLSVDQVKGSKGFTAVHVTWSANTTGEARTGKIVFTAGSYSDAITVTQAAK